MRVVIVGAGAIGSLVGGRLALADHEVTLVGRDRLREAVAADGLTIVTDGEARTTRAIRVATSVVGALGDSGFDLLVLTMKSHAVEAALVEIGAVTAIPPAILTLQNGLGTEERVAGRFGVERVLAGTITIPVEMTGPARIETVSKGGIGVAPLAREAPDPVAAVAALGDAEFTVRVYEDARAMKWSKLLLNMMGNATSAILGWPPGRVFADPRLYDAEMAALDEARRVMAALDIGTVRLPGYPVPLLMLLLRTLPHAFSRPLMQRLVARGRSGKMPSLFMDLEAGRPRLEIDALNGAIVVAGEEVGVATPVNSALTETLQGLASGRLARSTFCDKPEALLAVIRAARAVG